MAVTLLPRTAVNTVRITTAGELLPVVVFFSSTLEDDARTAFGTGFDFERNLENLLEQFPLVDGSRRADAEAFAAVQENDLVRELRSQT